MYDQFSCNLYRSCTCTMGGQKFLITVILFLFLWVYLSLFLRKRAQYNIYVLQRHIFYWKLSWFVILRTTLSGWYFHGHALGSAKSVVFHSLNPLSCCFFVFFFFIYLNRLQKQGKSSTLPLLTIDKGDRRYHGYQRHVVLYHFDTEIMIIDFLSFTWMHCFGFWQNNLSTLPYYFDVSFKHVKSGEIIIVVHGTSKRLATALAIA